MLLTSCAPPASGGKWNHSKNLFAHMFIRSLSWKNYCDWESPLLGKASVWKALWKVERSQGEAWGKRAKSSCSTPTLAKPLGNEGNCLTPTLSAYIPAGEVIRCRQMTQEKDALGWNGLSACERQKDVQVRPKSGKP